MKHLLVEASNEIRRLRQANEILGAQVAVVDVFRMALQAPEPRVQPMGMDIVWEIERELEALEAKPKAKAEQP